MKNRLVLLHRKQKKFLCNMIHFILVLAICVGLLPSGTVSIAEDSENNSSLTVENAPAAVKNVLEKYASSGTTLSNDEADDLSSVTLDHHDGTKTRIAFNHQIKYKDADNKVKFKNDKLKKNNKLFSSYAFENDENSVKTYFPKKIKSGVLLEADNFSINFQPITNKNAKAVKKTVEYRNIAEEVIEYRDVFGNGTALQYQPSINGVKENIVLDRYTGQNTFQFRIDFGDLQPETLEAAAIYLIDPETKEIAATLGQPYVFDSFSGECPDGERHDTFSNTLKLTKDDAGWILSVIIDPEFLKNENTVYPVVIDPTIEKVEGRNGIEDTTIFSQDSKDYSPYLEIYVGDDPALGKPSRGEGRVLVKFKKISSYKDIIPENIIDASYVVNETSDTPDKITNVRLYKVLQQWDYSVTWKNCPKIGDFICDKTVKLSGEYSFPIRELFQTWLSDYRSFKVDTGCSFMLRGYTSSGEWVGPQKWFLSVDASPFLKDAPYFSVTYTDNANLADGVYYIRNQQSGKYLDILGQYTDSGTNVHQWEFHGGFSQQWRVKKNADGYYIIRPMSAPERSLDVINNYSANESNIVIYGTNYSGNSSQWKIIYNSYGDSTYRLMNRASGDSKAMVVEYASSENGANIFQYDYSYLGNRNDDWVFERADVCLPTPMVVQSTDHWCWAACAEMAARTYNIGYSRQQGDAVEYITGVLDPNAGGNISEIERAAEYISNNQIDFYSAAGRIYSPNILTRLLKNGNPVIITFMPINTGGKDVVGHAVIVYGFYYYMGNEELRFRVKDPKGFEYISTYDELKQFALSQKWDCVAVRNVYKADDTIPAF